MPLSAPSNWLAPAGARVALVLALGAGFAPTAPAAPAQAPEASTVRAAVVRARPALERSVETFVSKRSCVSCHHNSVALLTFAALDRHGLGVRPRVRAALEAKTLFELRRASAFDDAVQGANLGDPAPNDTYLLMAAHAAGMAPDATLGVHARRIGRWQQPDGHWTTSDFRPPHSSSLFTATATAVRAMRLYMPASLAVERDATVARATAWLAATAPLSTEDASFRVMGLAWGGTTAPALAAAVADLRARQLPSGGWAQLPGYRPDAYSTGEALVAMREAGVSASDAGWRLGVTFLLETQAADGTWRTRTRMVSPATVSPPYFPTGFPYGKDEYLSFTGSCWAVMALLSALSDLPPQGPAIVVSTEGQPPAWAPVAAFGSTRELAAALDSGLDPNSVTAGGTTLLMVAAHDADKVRLLLERGAAPGTRSPSGADPLIVASGYGGNANAIRLLLEKGVSPSPPQAVRVRRLPIVFAAMTGDVDTVSVLLAHGAAASGEAVSEAVTFDRPTVVRRLIEAKADVTGEDTSGINLLHWATITNRPAVIPLLAATGLSVDAADARGYTPLMYAASIDFGEMEALRALLAAGADTRATNEDGRTALDLARRHGHRQMAAVLEPSSGTRARAKDR
jgi:ankyrin repeat protein